MRILYRLGNAASPKLQNVRPQDVDSYENNGIQMVYANGKGVSLFNLQELQRRESGLSGWVWKIPQGTLPLPALPFVPTPPAPATSFCVPFLL
jgi:hypothetical protein